MSLASAYKQLPTATRRLLAVCAGGYVLSLLLGPVLYYYFGLVPVLLVHKFWLWQPFTYIFLHGSFTHLLLNCFMLWMLGRLVEPAMGTRRFTHFFFITGIGAALFNVLLTPSSPVPIVGASGAIFGLLLAFAMLYPDSTVYLYFVIPVKAKYLAVVLGIMELLLSFASSRTGIANLAHLGGLITGYIYLKMLRKSHAAAPAVLHFIPGRSHTSDMTYTADYSAGQSELDELLDKVRAGGLDSLSAKERRRLDEFAGRRRHDHS